MEAALLMLDTLGVMVLVFTSLRNDRLGSRDAQSGPFRFVANRLGRRRRSAFRPGDQVEPLVGMPRGTDGRGGAP